MIYGTDVEKFADGNGDGIGDFVGLTDRMPYIADLGVTCVWLLPFFGSPGRDNDYDVSDYYAIHSRVGTRADFLDFLHQAGEHGIRVTIDLVTNQPPTSILVRGGATRRRHPLPQLLCVER